VTVPTPGFQDIDGMNDADWPTKNGSVSFVKDQHGFDAPDLDGVDDDLRRPSLAITADTKMSIGMWFRVPPGTSGAQTFTSMNTDGSNRQFIFLMSHLADHGRIKMIAQANGAGSIGTSSETSLGFDNDVWRHLMTTVEGSDINIYINAVEQAYVIQDQNLGGGGPFTFFGGTLAELTIGTDQEFPAARTKGILARPKYWLDVKLTDDQVREELRNELALLGDGRGGALDKILPLTLRRTLNNSI